MKKALLIALLGIASFSLFARQELLIQGTFMNSARTFEQGGTEAEYTVPSLGINVVGFNDFGGIGFFSTGTFLLPQEFNLNVNGSTHDYIDTYDSFKIVLDAMVGPGVNIPLGFAELLIGGGLHFNGLALMTNDYDVDSFLSYTLGAGLSANMKFPLSDNFNLNIGAMGGYDFAEIVHIPEWEGDVDFKSGLTALAVNAGIGFKY